ncbi:hypothetical protein ACFL0V_06445, partial [Nanoarchaeota archaeon]
MPYLFNSNNFGVLTMSSKSIANYILVLLALVVMISGSVGAITENFNAFTAKNTVNVCACDLTEQTLTIANTGEVTSTYMLGQLGDAAKWADIAPQAFYLEPGETKNVRNFVKVPCGVKGEFELNTSIQTVFEFEKTLAQKVNVENCA